MVSVGREGKRCQVVHRLQDAASDATLSEDTNRAKLEADLIYQQQRLILCQTDPANCPK